MKIKNLFVLLLVISTSLSLAIPSIATDTLVATDFQLESFVKTIDFCDYARAYATLHGIPTPEGFSNWHAYMYTAYVNTKGLHMLYTGLSNVSFGGVATLTVPMQSVLIHYKTNNQSRDVIMAQTFLMLLAFNETASTLYPDSPDMNDALWASFSMGFDFSPLNNTIPALSSKTEIIPLTYSDDKLQWSWGMKYTNLTAIWWRTWIAPNKKTFDSWPVALATYDELTFTYNLTIDPATDKATLTENHVIGRIRQLWHFWGGIILVLNDHYNSTGCYRNGQKIRNETVHDFIQKNQIKMSIVNFQTSIIADRNTYSLSATGQNVTDTDNTISNSSITTYADDGEKIADATFGTKQAYKLYNYTADPNETTYDLYDSTTRTTQINGFAQNTRLFQNHINLMKFLPLLIAHMRPQLYQRAKDSIANMSRANYFYVIGYPEYDGYRIEHDPTLTVYLDTAATDVNGSDMFNPQSLKGLVIIGAVAAVMIVAAALIIRKRKPKASTTETVPPQPPS